MKNLYKSLSMSAVASLMFLSSCNKDNVLGKCDPVSLTVTEFGVTSTIEFSDDLGGKISSAKFYEGTDSAVYLTYQYTDKILSKIEQKNPVTGAVDAYYTIEMIGDNVSMYQYFVYEDPQYVLKLEAQYEYGATSISAIKFFLANASGTLFQFADIAYTVSANNVVKARLNHDLVTEIQVPLGLTPVGYDPLTDLEVQQFLHDGSKNPLLDNIIPKIYSTKSVNIGWISAGISDNVATEVIITPRWKAEETDTYELTYNKNELVTSGTSVNKSYTVTYKSCK